MTGSLLVTNIQRMCFHDGPGIRTTVFLKGCSIHCPWCSNPENINPSIEEYDDGGKTGTYGRWYSCKELVDELGKDCLFFENGGGITFSGGEPLLQSKALFPIVAELNSRHINVAVETALFVPPRNLIGLAELVDHFIVDIKILEKESCLNKLGGELGLYYENVDYLHQRKKIAMFRIPLCREYTYTDENLELLAGFLSNYRDVLVQVFSVHKLGEKKYKSLGKEMPLVKGVDKEALDEFCSSLIDKGIKAEVIRI